MVTDLVNRRLDGPGLAQLFNVFAGIVGHADRLGQAVFDELLHVAPILGERGRAKLLDQHFLPVDSCLGQECDG